MHPCGSTASAVKADLVIYDKILGASGLFMNVTFTYKQEVDYSCCVDNASFPRPDYKINAFLQCINIVT